jgi:hypothetical protein
MNDTVKHLQIAYLALGRAIQSSRGRKTERLGTRLWFAFDLVKDIREYELIRGKR